MLATSLLPSHGTGLCRNLLLVRAAQFTRLLLRAVQVVGPVVALRVVKAGHSTSRPIQPLLGKKLFSADSHFLLHSTTCQQQLFGSELGDESTATINRNSLPADGKS